MIGAILLGLLILVLSLAAALYLPE